MCLFVYFCILVYETLYKYLHLMNKNETSKKRAFIFTANVVSIVRVMVLPWRRTCWRAWLQTTLVNVDVPINTFC